MRYRVPSGRYVWMAQMSPSKLEAVALYATVVASLFTDSAGKTCRSELRGIAL
jgi:hypothetical protein